MIGENMLELKNVTKHYRANLALNNFCTKFDNGIYAILGPNGSGKSTLMNIIVGNQNADNNNCIFWNGKCVHVKEKSYRALIGFMPQQQGMYNNFTANQFLYYMAALKNIEKKDAGVQIQKYLKILELDDVANKNIGSFSGGMKQRLLIIQSLMGNPKIVLLDEPTAGLDPRQRILVRDLIQSEAQDKIVIIATHIVSDVEAIANQVIFLKKGVVVAEDTSENLANLVADSDKKNLENAYMMFFGDDNENI